MFYLDVSRILATLTTLAITYGSYKQAWKIWKSRSVRDISFSLVAAWLLNELAWLNYGFALREGPIIFMTLIGIPPALAGTVGYLKFHGATSDKTSEKTTLE